MTPEPSHDPHDLQRFLQAQEPVYDKVLAELGRGRKGTHWMWFIFPQLDGLGHSGTAKYYSIKSLDEAREYLKHPVLGKRLVECTKIVLGFKDRSIADIFRYPDDLKFRSCMTLFDSLADDSLADTHAIFDGVLRQCFAGKRDSRTRELLEGL